ncbi:MAG: (2Fe-2S)-binding protein [Acidobacteriota bacterium]|nr:(2Fe-2S)-binding protein [Acidobacteriota bacterium]
MNRDAKSNSFFITVNGQQVLAKEGMSVAAAILSARQISRKSISGEPRAPLCGMGICMECCATVNGEQHKRTCQLLCADGMEIEAQ